MLVKKVFKFNQYYISTLELLKSGYLMIKEINRHIVQSKEYKAGTYPKGCEYCAKGEKITFYVNFKCDYMCFYCGVPAELRGTDSMLVGNMLVKNMKEAMKHLKKYKCVAISGGEPLIHPNNILGLIKKLKKQGIYSYLFTDGSPYGRLTTKLLDELIGAGLDEIKMSAKLGEDEKEILFEPFKIIKYSDIPIHAELPMIPTLENEVFDFAVKLNEIGASHLLLDELECSSGNINELLKRGFNVKEGTVVGSEEAAFEVVDRTSEAGLNIKVLYCASLNPKHQYKKLLIS